METELQPSYKLLRALECCKVGDREISGKNFFQYCRNSQHKKPEKSRLGPGDDLPEFLSMNYRQGLYGELIVGGRHRTDSTRKPNPNQCQKTEHCGKTCQDGKSLDKPKDKNTTAK